MNNENNINGIPSINDVKTEDTPAQSFANLYGNGAQQPTQPVQSQPMPNPQVAQPQQPVQQPVPPVQNPQMPQQANPQVAQPQPMPNPQVVQPQPVQQPVPPVQNPQMPQQPNPQVVQPVQIDADRMQSIEEQLSKTSQYKPEDFQQEKIDIPTTNQYEKNKSGLAFVIVLFIILAVVIVLLPQITKWLS